MDAMPATPSSATDGPAANVPGGPVKPDDRILEGGAAMIQDFAPLKNVCAHLNAFHTYASEPGRYVEANHYCAHLTHNVRQCILYDSPLPNARLIGIEYMITPDLYATLEPEERKRWHTHVFEVKSGMLIMPGPTGSHPSHTPGSVLTGLKEAVLGAGPQQAWEAAETAEMEKVVELYGKIYHLWQTDRGDKLPVGEPQLMTSFTEEGQFDFAKAVGERDRRFGTDHERKRELRKGIEEPKLHEDADWAWKSRRKSL